MHFSPGFKKYFANTSWLMAERILSMVVGLFVGIYVARYLGPSKFGLLNYAISFVGLFSVLASLGLDQIAVREFVKQTRARETILGTVFWLKFMGAFFVLVLISITLYLTESDSKTQLLVLVIAAGLIFQSLKVVEFYFLSKVSSKYVVFAQTFQIILSAVLKIALVIGKADLLWFGMVILADSLFLGAGLLYFFYAQQKNFILGWKFDSGLAISLLLESWPLALSGLVVTVYMKIDQVMIKEMLDSEAVGLYAVAVGLSEVWFFLPTIVLKSLFPALVSMKQKNDGLYLIRLQQLHDMLSAMAFPIAIGIFFFSEDIVRILYGTQFAGAGAILAVHIWGGMLVFPGNIRAHLIVIENKQVIALVFRSIGAVLNVALNYYLIPRFGAIGAAWATLASYILPICIVSFFDSLIRLTVIMTLKSYLFPFRALIYRKSLYSALRHA